MYIARNSYKIIIDMCLVGRTVLGWCHSLIIMHPVIFLQIQ